MTTQPSCAQPEPDPRPWLQTLPDGDDQQTPQPGKTDREKELQPPGEPEPEGAN